MSQVFKLIFDDRKAFLRIRLNYLWLLLLSSILLCICTLIGLCAFRWTAGSTPRAFGLSVITLVTSVLDLYRGHLILHSIFTQIWLHTISTLVLLGFSSYALTQQMLELKADPVGWWTDPFTIVVIRFISLSLTSLCFLWLLKSVVLMTEVLYQGIYLGRSDIWASNILEWDWWGKGLQAIIPNTPRGGSISSSFRISHRCESDPLLSTHREILRPEPLVFRTRGHEPPFLARIRGSIVVMIFFGLFLYGAGSIMVGSQRETGAMPAKPVFVQDNDPSWNDRHKPAPVWSVVVAMDESVLQPGIQLASAVTVTPLWDTEFLSPQLSGGASFPSCELVSESTDEYTDYGNDSKGTRIATFFCPELHQRQLTLVEWVTADIRATSPDLLVSIDYNALGVSLKDHLSVQNTAFVFMAFTNDTTLVTRTSFSLPAISRTHNLATIRYRGRQTINTNSVSLGILPSYTTFFFADLDTIGPDPYAIIPENDNTASLRLFTYFDPSDWRVVQDHPEYSIFNVLSSLGGMWTVFNGVFAVIFGGSMLLVFGVKPLSVFGFAHRACGRQIRKGLKHDFYDLEKEAFHKPPAGMSAFLEHYVLDLSIMKPENGADALCMV